MRRERLSVFPSHAARALRPDLLRAAALLWLPGLLALLALHFAREMAPDLTANGTVAFGDDTINFWGAARLAITGRADAIFDFARFHAFQVGVLGGPIHAYHYGYPPVAILLCLPLVCSPIPGRWPSGWPAAGSCSR
jgi:hypothetical protein